MENQLTVSTFEVIKPRFTEIVDETTFKKEISFAMQALSKNSYLAGATQKSILESVLNIAQIGLTLNPAMKMAYLVPRRVGGEVVCCLEPSYQGLCKLVTDTGSVKNIYAHVVHEKDFFQQTLGTDCSIIHRPALGERGNIIAVYAIGILIDERVQVEVMDVSDINKIRDRSEGYKSFKSGNAKTAIWETDYSEMARKTVVKRLTKYLPKTNAWDKVQGAIETMDSDYKIDFMQMDMIEQLMKTSSMDEEKKQFHLNYLNTYTRAEANDLIDKLRSSQVNAILSGNNYNQSQITEHVKNSIDIKEESKDETKP